MKLHIGVYRTGDDGDLNREAAGVACQASIGLGPAWLERSVLEMSVVECDTLGHERAHLVR